jgi:S1-C subfamily serine protease
MRSIQIFILIGVVYLVSACSKSDPLKEKAQSLKMSVIYGKDNRQDLYQVTDQNKYTLAMSTVALIYKENLEAMDDTTTRIKTRSYGDTYKLCQEEPFYEQEIAAFCSGFLVGPQTVVTAGHCIRAQTCERVRFVFGFGITSAGNLPRTVETNNVYACKNIVQSATPSSNDKDYGPDFAVVTLDRPVENHPYLNLRRDSEVQTSEPLFVIGHPAGLPTKVSDGANVRDVNHEAYFLANLDTYGGNSGSAVFNENSGLIEGILVRGELDYITKKDSKCQVSNTCKDDGCQGEAVTKIKYVLPYLN